MAPHLKGDDGSDTGAPATAGLVEIRILLVVVECNAVVVVAGRIYNLMDLHFVVDGV